MTRQIDTIKLIFTAVIALAMITCFGDCTNKENRAAQLEQEIMQIHDSAMSEMSHMLKLRNDISGLIKTITSPLITDSLNKASYLLTKADKDMMKWMHEYEKPGMNTDTAVTYLDMQHAKIVEVANETAAAIKNAEQVLEYFNQ